MSAAVQINRREAGTNDSWGMYRVTEYKLYCLDQRGRIQRRHEFEAADDAAAIAAARDEFPTETCELWSGTRKVALIPAKGMPVLARPAA